MQILSLLDVIRTLIYLKLGKIDKILTYIYKVVMDTKVLILRNFKS